MRRMFGSTWSLSAAIANCSSATSHGSRWVWSMTALLAFTSTSDASWCPCFELFDHEPIIGRLAGRVCAVPILEHDSAKALRLERVTPRSQPARDVRRQPHIRTWREDAFEMPPALEEWDVEKRLTVDLQEIERGEDLLTCELPRVRVAMLVYLEIALVLPAVDQDTVDDRGAALRFGDDRVVQLAGPGHLPLVAKEMGLRVADSDEDPGAGPRRFEDVALPLRSFADRPGPLGQKICPEDGAQDSSIRALDRANVCSIMRTPVRNWFLGVHRSCRIRASFVLPSRGVPLPITTARRGGIRVLADATSRVLTLPCATPGAADGRPAPRGRGGRHAFWPSVAPHLPRKSIRLGGYFFSPSPRAAMIPASGPARLVNSVGMMNFVAGDDPSWLSVLKYWRVIVRASAFIAWALMVESASA